MFPRTNSIFGEKIEVDSAEQTKPASRRSALLSEAKVKAKTWCRATEGEAVRHSYWSIIQAVCAAQSVSREREHEYQVSAIDVSTNCLGSRP